VTIIVRCADHMKFAACMAVCHILSYSVGSVLYHCICGCVLCMLLLNFEIVYSYFCIYLFLLLYMFISGYSVIFCCSVVVLFVSKCVLYCTIAAGCQPNCS
jgi:hypothetical protein